MDSKERRKAWQRKNQDKIREYERNRLRRKYLAEFLADRKKQQDLGKEVATNGQIIAT